MQRLGAAHRREPVLGAEYQLHRTANLGCTLNPRAIVIAGAHVGKLIPVGFSNPRSGLRLTVSAGLLQHKIRIQDDPLSFVPHLDDDYKKGYDKLSNGLAFTEFVGYQLLSTNKRINFFAGFEFTQGFTMNRRAFDFDTRQQDTANRVDLNVGFRVGWVLPFYVGQRASEEIYY